MASPGQAAGEDDGPTDDPPTKPPFERGQLVWAKLTGFPWWPSRVRRLERVPQAEQAEAPTGATAWRARVRFCGTNFGDSRDFATIGCASTNMITFKEKLDEWSAKMPYSGKSKVIRKQWKSAVEQARIGPEFDLEADEEERAEAEAVAAAAAEAAEAAAAEAAIWAEGWRSDGHELLGARVARRFQGIGGGRPYLGTITRWLPPVAPSPSCDARDEEEAKTGITSAAGTDQAPEKARISRDSDAGAAAVAEAAARCTCAMINAPSASSSFAAVTGVTRSDGGNATSDASEAADIVRDEVQVAPKVVGDDEILFHVVMDDGDEEDLEQYEVDAALALWRSTAEGVRAFRAEAKAAEHEWSLLEREARRAARRARGHDGIEPPMDALAIYKRHIEAVLGEAVDDAGIPEVSEFVLEEFSSLTDAERAPFERRAARDCLRYHRQRRLKRKRTAKERKARAAMATEEAKGAPETTTKGEDGVHNGDVIAVATPSAGSAAPIAASAPVEALNDTPPDAPSIAHVSLVVPVPAPSCPKAFDAAAPVDHVENPAFNRQSLKTEASSPARPSPAKKLRVGHGG